MKLIIMKILEELYEGKDDESSSDDGCNDDREIIAIRM